MQVTPINSNTNFNGSRGTSFNLLAQGIYNRRLEGIYENACRGGRSIDSQKLQKVSDDFDKIIEDIDSFMSKLHPKTKLEVVDRDYSDIGGFSFQNPIGRCDFTAYRTIFDVLSVLEGRPCPIGKEAYMPGVFEDLAKFAKYLCEFEPKDVEKAIFEDAIAEVKKEADDARFWFERMILRRRIKAIFKYADEVGIESDITKESLLNEVNQIFLDNKNARHNAIVNAIEIERIEKQNRKTVNRYKL